MGRCIYPHATELLITADAGGSNGYLLHENIFALGYFWMVPNLSQGRFLCLGTEDLGQNP